MALAACATAVAACGGHGTSIPSVTPAPKVTPAAQQQAPITSSSGGTISASIPGGGSLAVQIPAKSLSANATVTIDAYTSLAQATAGISASVRHVDTASLPSGTVFLAGFAIDTGSAAVLAPLQVTETLAIPTVASGYVVRVARLNPKGAFTDVDTATVSNGSATNDLNKQYVSVSNGGTAAPYVIYAVPQTAAATPAPIVMSASSPPNQQIAIGGTGTFTVSGADANGNPLPFVPSFDTDNHAIATAVLGSTMFTAAVTAAGHGGIVNLLVTDSRTGTGKVPFTVYTQRPSNSGNSFAFAGTVNEADTFAYPSPTLPPTNVTANVTQNVTVSATANPYGAGAVSDFKVIESDAYPTQTYKTTTDYYYQQPAADFELLGYSAIDDQGNTTAVQYGTPQTVDELPETKDAAWTNSPAMTLAQVFVGQETASRTVNADGTYTDREDVYSGTGGGTNYPAMQVVLSDSADGSSSLQYTYNYTGTTRTYTSYTVTWAVTAPYVPSPAPGATPGAAQVDVYQSSSRVVSTPAPSPAPVYQFSLSQWYQLPLYTETDKNLGSATIPSSCAVPSAFGTTAMQLEQQVNSLDTALGSTETRKTDTYVVTGFGPVCVQVSDVTNAYYDFQNDTGYKWYYNSTPMQTSTVSETLTLQSSGTSTAPQNRRVSVAQLQPIAPGAVALAREHVQFIAERNRMLRLRSIGRRIYKAILKGGLR